MKKKLEYILIILIILSSGYWMLSQATKKITIDESIPVSIYENYQHLYDSTIIIEGTIFRYYFSDRQYFNGTFSLKHSSLQAPDTWITWSKDEDNLIQTIKTPGAFQSRYDQWILIDRDMHSFAFNFEGYKTAATSDYALDIFRELAKEYYSPEN